VAKSLGKQQVNPSAVLPLNIVKIGEESEELVILDAVLTKLAQIDERKAKVVEYRYFGGFTLTEVAEMLGVSPATVEREWRLARSWLLREMTGTSEK
jgi:RNA polymerase sigma-70 factor, ECF subfamily